MKEALLIIDVQNDYFPGGTNELPGSIEAERMIQKLLLESRQTGRTVIYVKHLNSEGCGFLVEGTHGAEIASCIAPLPGEKVITKRCPSSFLGTDLYQYLLENGIEQLVVCGMMSHMCVDTTVRAAMDYGIKVRLVSDACATMALTWNGITYSADLVHNVFMASLNGVFAEVV